MRSERICNHPWCQSYRNSISFGIFILWILFPIVSVVGAVMLDQMEIQSISMNVFLILFPSICLTMILGKKYIDVISAEKEMIAAQLHGEEILQLFEPKGLNILASWDLEVHRRQLNRGVFLLASVELSMDEYCAHREELGIDDQFQFFEMMEEKTFLFVYFQSVSDDDLSSKTYAFREKINLIYNKRVYFSEEAADKKELSQLVKNFKCHLAMQVRKGTMDTIDDRVNKTIELINQRYSDPMFSQQDASDIVHLCRSSMGRLFQKETGISFREYLIDVRMRKALHILNETNTKIDEIAEMVGYSNVTLFRKHFKEKYNCSPSDYRKKKQKTEKNNSN